LHTWLGPWNDEVDVAASVATDTTFYFATIGDTAVTDIGNIVENSKRQLTFITGKLFCIDHSIYPLQTLLERS
jgi:hypothetical protein